MRMVSFPPIHALLALLCSLLPHAAVAAVPTAVGEERSTLPDGRQAVFEVVEGEDGQSVRHGSFRVFAPESDDWLISGSFEMGVRDGTWRYRYDSREIAAIGKYKEGVRKGRWKYFWPDGSLAATGVFKGGALTGNWKLSDPLDPSDDSREVTIAQVQGASPIDGSVYAGFLKDGQPIGWWTIHRADGSLLFEGAFDQFGAPRALKFRHAGGLRDDEFFRSLRDVQHPHDFLFRDLDEVGGYVGGTDPASAPSVQEGVASLAGLWPLDQEYRSAEPVKLEPGLKVAKVIQIPPGHRTREFDPRPPAALRLQLAGAVKTLGTVDWSDEAATRSALPIVQNIVVPGLGYPDLGFEFSQSRATPERNGLAVLRAHSLLTIQRHDLDFWMIDAVVETTAPQTDLPLERIRGLDPMDWVLDSDRKDLAKTAPKRSKKKKLARNKPKGDEGRSEEAAEAIEAGLQWLVNAQQEDGRWFAGTSDFAGANNPQRDKESLGHDLGVTGIALLALVRDPSTPGNSERLDAIRRGLRFILGTRQEQWGPFVSVYRSENPEGKTFQGHANNWIYGHAAAVQALAESRSIVSSIRVELGLQDGVATLLRAKNPYGGWRYALPANGDVDTSITFWATRALLAVKDLEPATMDEIKRTVLNALNLLTDENGRTGYVEAGSMSARFAGDHQVEFPTEVGETLTAEAVALRKWLGDDDREVVTAGVELILRSLPEWSETRKTVDFGYWLAGTEAMHQVGGKYAKAWDRALTPVLLDHQIKRPQGFGSWDPIGVWGFIGGRTVSTASAVMSLQMLSARDG